VGGLENEADAVVHSRVLGPVPAGIVELKHDALASPGANRFGKIREDESDCPGVGLRGRLLDGARPTSPAWPERNPHREAFARGGALRASSDAELERRLAQSDNSDER
jgi:hypothetical protein